MGCNSVSLPCRKSVLNLDIPSLWAPHTTRGHQFLVTKETTACISALTGHRPGWQLDEPPQAAVMSDVQHADAKGLVGYTPASQVIRDLVSSQQQAG